MERIAVFAGTFDPFTLGHQDIALRALTLFDRLIIAIGVNSVKKTLFSLESREAIIRDSFPNMPQITIASFNGLTVDLCRQYEARFLIRGLRSGTDFDYERTIAQANNMVYPDIETVFLVTRKEHAPIASTVVRDLLIHGYDASAFLPAEIDIRNYKRTEAID